MSATPIASLKTWLTEPMAPEVAGVIERVRRADDVRHVAVMPDVHLAQDVCVGVVIATGRLAYPAAVGGDIGCGMLAVAFDAEAAALADANLAGRLLREITLAVPATRRHRTRKIDYPDNLRDQELSHPSLDALARGDGALQLGTLGGGNHFIELQSDDHGRLWLMIHSGSRCMGQAIRNLYLSRAKRVAGGLAALDTRTDAGRAYLNDLDWARRYADANRRAMAEKVAEIVRNLLAAQMLGDCVISCDHNHLAVETHGSETLLVHRKGAMPAAESQSGVLPGSMGTLSFHVEGRGCADSLRSSAHGAGRALSRHQARQRITVRALMNQMSGVWFDHRAGRSLVEEAPAAYKDVRAVLRAQRDLVRVVRTLKPLLVYKIR